jgi:hypothetical protein
MQSARWRTAMQQSAPGHADGSPLPGHRSECPMVTDAGSMSTGRRLLPSKLIPCNLTLACCILAYVRRPSEIRRKEAARPMFGPIDRASHQTDPTTGGPVVRVMLPASAANAMRPLGGRRMCTPPLAAKDLSQPEGGV